MTALARHPIGQPCQLVYVIRRRLTHPIKHRGCVAGNVCVITNSSSRALPRRVSMILRIGALPLPSTSLSAGLVLPISIKTFISPIVARGCWILGKASNKTCKMSAGINSSLQPCHPMRQARCNSSTAASTSRTSANAVLTATGFGKRRIVAAVIIPSSPRSR